MTPSLTLITSHALDGPESESNQDEQRRFAEFVDARQPQLLDFQAYVSEDKRELKLMFVFPDGAGTAPRTAGLEPGDRPFRDSGLAGILAATAIVLLVFAGAYLGSFGGPAA